MTPTQLATFWHGVHERLRDATTESTHALWLAGVEAIALDGPARVLYVRAPAEVESWIQDRFQRVLDRCASEQLGDDIAVKLVRSDDRETAAAAARLAARTAALAEDEGDPVESEAPSREYWPPSAHPNIRVPRTWLRHYPLERDPFAQISWRSRDRIRRWSDVQADIAIDHISRPAHLRAMLGVAACIQLEVPADRTVTVMAAEFARAAGIARPGSQDKRTFLRVFADWNRSEHLNVAVRPLRADEDPRTVITGPPADRVLAVLRSGEVAEPADLLHQDAGELRAEVIAFLITVSREFADEVADLSRCLLLSMATITSARRALPTYLRFQTVSRKERGERWAYTHQPFLHQLGFHSRRDLAELVDRPHDSDEIRNIERIVKKHQRNAEMTVVDDLLWLRGIDRSYAWVRAGDHGTGAATIRVGVGEQHGPRAAAEQPCHQNRRDWHREVRRLGLCPAERRTLVKSFEARRAEQRRRRAAGHADVAGVLRSGSARQRRVATAREQHRRVPATATGPAHDG